MPQSNGDGRAYVAGWIIKLLAGAFLAGSLGWAGSTTSTNSTQDIDIAVLKTHYKEFKEQQDRIERKLDGALSERK